MILLRRLAMVFAISLAAGCAAQNTAPATAYRIAGTIVDAISGQPLTDADVIVTPASEQKQDNEVSFRTGPDGHFVFSNLVPGKYSLGARRHGYALQGYNQHEMFATAIVTGPGLDTEHILFRLQPNASIRGTITDEQNDPAPNIEVNLFALRMQNGEKSVRQLSQNMTDDRGQYSFGHLQAGTYYVAASGRPWYSVNTINVRQMQQQSADPDAKARMEQDAAKLDLVYPLTFYSGALSSDDATPIHLSPGDNVTADMTLQPVRSMHIHVPAPPNIPTQDNQGRGSITLSGGGRRPPQIRLTQKIFGGTVEYGSPVTPMSWEPDGSYDIDGIAPGRYDVQVNSFSRSAEAPSTSQELDVTGNIDLPSSSATQLAHVNGTMWLNGKPIERGVVEMRTPDGSRAFATPVQKGQFQFQRAIPPGQYQVAILAMADDDVYLSSLAATGAKVSERSVQIVPGASVTLAVFAAAGVAQIDGIAKLKDKPIGGVMVLLVPEDLANDARLIRRDQSDSDGTFTLRHVVPGRYRLLALENGWNLAWADAKIVQPYLANARPYVIQPNQKLQVTVAVQSAK